ncbi:hypothetical protein CsSME_00037766 [Camellia sinensis var. sinensis]
MIVSFTKFCSLSNKHDLLVKSEGILEEKECFVDEASLALTLLPMKEVVAICFLDSKKIMECHEVEASWVLDDLCFREMPPMLSKPFVPLCVDLSGGWATAKHNHAEFRSMSGKIGPRGTLWNSPRSPSAWSDSPVKERGGGKVEM